MAQKAWTKIACIRRSSRFKFPKNLFRSCFFILTLLSLICTAFQAWVLLPFSLCYCVVLTAGLHLLLYKGLSPLATCTNNHSTLAPVPNYDFILLLLQPVALLLLLVSMSFLQYSCSWYRSSLSACSWYQWPFSFWCWYKWTFYSCSCTNGPSSPPPGTNSYSPPAPSTKSPSVLVPGIYTLSPSPIPTGTSSRSCSFFYSLVLFIIFFSCSPDPFGVST
jgi:hypothetical protein